MKVKKVKGGKRMEIEKNNINSIIKDQSPLLFSYLLPLRLFSLFLFSLFLFSISFFSLSFSFLFPFLLPSPSFAADDSLARG